MYVQARSRIEVNREECTGCGYCVESCERKALKISAVMNHYGVYPVQHQDEVCQGCGTCYYFCPEPRAITLHRMDAHDQEERYAPAA